MRFAKPLFLGLALALASCGGGKFQNFQGTLTAEQTATLLTAADEGGKATIVKVDGTAAGASEALLKAGQETTVVVKYSNANGAAEFELKFTPEGGKSYSTKAKSEERDTAVPGSMKKMPFAAVWIEADGKVVAGTDAQDSMKHLK